MYCVHFNALIYSHLQYYQWINSIPIYDRTSPCFLVKASFFCLFCWLLCPQCLEQCPAYSGYSINIYWMNKMPIILIDLRLCLEKPTHIELQIWIHYLIWLFLLKAEYSKYWFWLKIPLCCALVNQEFTVSWGLFNTSSKIS